MAGIYALSAIPGTFAADDPAVYQVFLWVPPNLQNLLHVPVFAVLAALWCRAAHLWLGRLIPSALAAWTITTGYGWLDEWHQLHVPGRYASFTDFLLDAVGATLGVAMMLLHHRRRSATARG